jgi:hypothetical protein
VLRLFQPVGSVSDRRTYAGLLALPIVCVNEQGGASVKAFLRLDLQPLIASVYACSHYDRRLHYASPLQPPLSEEESAWLAEQLRSRA